MKNKIIIFPFLALALMMTGCFGVNGDFRQIRNTVFDNVDADFDTEFEISVGRGTIRLAGFFAKHSREVRRYEDVIDDIYKVQVGVYKSNYLDRFHNSRGLFKELSGLMENKKYTQVVRSADEDELVMIYMKTTEESLPFDIFIVAVNDDEAVLVNLKGKLDNVMETLEEEGAFSFLDRKK